MGSSKGTATRPMSRSAAAQRHGVKKGAMVHSVPWVGEPDQTIGEFACGASRCLGTAASCVWKKQADLLACDSIAPFPARGAVRLIECIEAAQLLLIVFLFFLLFFLLVFLFLFFFQLLLLLLLFRFLFFFLFFLFLFFLFLLLLLHVFLLRFFLGGLQFGRASCRLFLSCFFFALS